MKIYFTNKYIIIAFSKKLFYNKNILPCQEQIKKKEVGVEMKENVNPFLAIKANYIQMNPAMKRIADVLLEDPPKRGGYTIGMLAEKSGVSNATVTRFVRALGFGNYKTFLRAIQESFEDGTGGAARSAMGQAVLYAGGFPNSRDAESVCRYVIGSEVEMLNDTLSLLDFDLMEKVAEMILESRQVLFMGEGHSYLAAQSACLRFRMLGVLCNCFGDFQNMISGVGMAEPGDLVVGISNMGYSSPVTECLTHAAKRGIQTVAVTGVKGSPVSQAADISIMTGFNYGSFSNQNQSTCYEPGSENMPQYSVIDSLYLMCVMRKDESFLERYYDTLALVDEKRL